MSYGDICQKCHRYLPPPVDEWSCKCKQSMTDLEMTKLCVDIETRANSDALTDADVAFIVERFTAHGIVPTHAQALALVKTFHLGLNPPDPVTGDNEWMIGYECARNADLNRAIVECVAETQAGK